MAADDPQRGPAEHDRGAYLNAIRRRMPLILLLTGVVTAINMQPAVVHARNLDRQTMVEVVDRDYFAAVGTPMMLGRPILSADDRPGAPPVAVLSLPFWREHFAATPDALGSVIALRRGFRPGR